MPKHGADQYEEVKSSKHKKHKHSRDSEDRKKSHKKKSRHDETISNSERHKSMHRTEIKKERTQDYREFQNDNHEHSSHRRIKREEDFDRRQEELQQRRRDRSRYHDQPERVKREYPDHERNQPSSSQERQRHDEERRNARRRRNQEGQVEEAFKNSETKDAPEKIKPNLELSGALTEDTNTFRGVVIKYNEPPEARIPKKKWRLYPFKGTEALKTLHLHRQSAYLLGRLRRIADIPIDHPSCSKQHAVLQFRVVECEVNGKLRRRVKPYVIDLGAANGTYVNNERIDAQRYVELKEKDVLKFGFSSREYVLLHDKSDTTEVQSDSEEEEED